MRFLFLILLIINFAIANPKEKVDEMLLKAWQYYEEGNYYMMLEQSKKTLNYALKHNVPKGIAEGYYYIGIAYFQMGDLDKSIKYANKAIEYSKDKSNYRWKAYAKNLLAEIMIRLKKYDEALKQYNDILKLSIENDNKRMIAVTYLDIGNVYFYKKNFKKALENFKKANEQMQNIKIRPYYLALVNYNLGMIYYRLNDFQNAIPYLEKSLNIYQKINDEKSTVETAYFLADSFYEIGDKEKALNTLESYKNLAKKVLLYRKFKKLEKKIKSS